MEKFHSFYDWVMKSESESCSAVSNSLQPHGLYSPWNSPGQNTWVGSLSLLQGIFSTQISNPGFPHCMRILYHLSHQGSPRLLEWVAFPFSSGPSWPRNFDPRIELGSPAFLHCRWILYQLSYWESPWLSNYIYIYIFLCW